MSKTRKALMGTTVAVILFAGAASAVAINFNLTAAFINDSVSKISGWVTQVQLGVSNNGKSIIKLDSRLDAIALTPGPQGETGAAGADGADGSNGIDGAVGPAGPTGSDGAVGATGAIGATGADGIPGVAGTFDIDNLSNDDAISIINQGFGGAFNDNASPQQRWNGLREDVSDNFTAIEELSSALTTAFATIDVNFVAPTVID